MSLDSMRRQINKLMAEIESRQPQEPSPTPEYVRPSHDAELLARFLAIDENRLPDYDHAPVVDGYHLYGTYFRHDRWQINYHLAQDRVDEEDVEKVRRWVETFGELEVKGR